MFHLTGGDASLRVVLAEHQVQRGHSRERVLAVWVGSRLDQEIHRVKVVFLCSNKKWAVLVLVLGVRVAQKRFLGKGTRQKLLSGFCPFYFSFLTSNHLQQSFYAFNKVDSAKIMKSRAWGNKFLLPHI